MFTQLKVTTPEGVTFSHDLAGVGSRCIATVIDFLIFICFLIALLILLAFISLITSLVHIPFDAMTLSMALYTVLSFTFLWCYRTFMESSKSGSIGYKLMGIRVISHRGNKPMFWQCALRGLLWPIEVIAFPIVAFICIVSTKKCQRLADLITGTLVVYHNRNAQLGTLHVQQAAFDPNAPFRAWELSQISDDEVYIIRRFLDRRVHLPQHIRLNLANRLYFLIWPKISGVPTDWYSEAVLESIAASRSVANER